MTSEILDHSVLGKTITIAGLGGNGSHIALARMGFARLILFDRDRVEAHNLTLSRYQGVEGKPCVFCNLIPDQLPADWVSHYGHQPSQHGPSRSQINDSSGSGSGLSSAAVAFNQQFALPSRAPSVYPVAAMGSLMMLRHLSCSAVPSSCAYNILRLASYQYEVRADPSCPICGDTRGEQL